MQSIFTTLAIIGTALPLSRLIPWLGEHGMYLRLFVEQLFVNPISSFFGLDVGGNTKGVAAENSSGKIAHPLKGHTLCVPHRGHRG